MISADVNANKNNNKKKIWRLYLTYFYQKYFQNLETQCKKGMYF